MCLLARWVEQQAELPEALPQLEEEVTSFGPYRVSMLLQLLRSEIEPKDVHVVEPGEVRSRCFVESLLKVSNEHELHGEDQEKEPHMMTCVKGTFRVCRNQSHGKLMLRTTRKVKSCYMPRARRRHAMGFTALNAWMELCRLYLGTRSALQRLEEGRRRW